MKNYRPDWDNSFANEKDTYKRLKPLQVRIMPHFVGSAEFDKVPSIVLSRLEGTPLCKQGPAALPAEDLEPQLEVILRAFTKFGVVHDDPKLDNFLLVKGRVMVVDLESVCEETKEDLEFTVQTHRQHIMLQYRRYLESLSDPRHF